MERRRFLELGALAGAGATSQACAPMRASTAPAATSDRTLRQRLRWLDRLLGSVELVRPRILRDHVPRELSSHEQADVRLTQSTLRSLLLTGSIADLPEEQRCCSEVVTRLDRAAPEVDYAIFGMMTRLSRMPAEEHAGVQQALREDPSIVDEIGDFLDQDSRDLGVPLRRRLHMRTLIRHVGWRLQRQSLSTVLGEHLDKVERLTQRSARGSLALLPVRPPPAEVERWSSELAHLVGLYDAGPVGDASMDPPPEAVEPSGTIAEPASESPVPATPEPSEEEASPSADVEPDWDPPPLVGGSSVKEHQRQTLAEKGKRNMIAGGSVMAAGIGLAVLSGSVVVVDLVGAVGLTVAAILLIIGLIILSVGAVRARRARSI